MPPDADTLVAIDPAALALFIRFVRLNYRLAEDDPIMLRVFEAYQTVLQDQPVFFGSQGDDPHGIDPP
jgi:hypothetical protein